jgi:hypothetical protein
MTVRYQMFGPYRATVVDNRDPNNQARLRLRIPRAFATGVTGWVPVRQTAGLPAVVPNIGAGVWVEFEGGDPSFPVWSGVFGVQDAGVITLNDLQDVASLSPSDGQVLRWSSDQLRWGSSTLTPADVGAAPAAHTHDASAIVSGTLPVARGGTGSVTLPSGGYLKGAGTSAVTSQVGIPGEDITSGTVNFLRLPTGTTASTVAVGNHTHAAADVISGTLDAARVPNLPDLNGTLTVAKGGTGATSLTSGGYLKGADTGAITSQTGIPAGDITSGTLPVGRGGTGATTFTSGAYLKGAGTGAVTTQTGIPAGDITSGTIDFARIATVPVNNGGTGATTASAALSNLGGAPLVAPSFSGKPTAPQMDFTSTTAATNDSVNHAIQVGPTSGQNVRISPTRIIAVNNGAYQVLGVNSQGGDVIIGNASSAITMNGRLTATHLPFAMAAGSVNITPTANSPSSATVTFPSGRFTQEPLAVGTPRTSVPGTVQEVGIVTQSATSMNVWLLRTNSTTTTIEWVAVQMNSSNASG